MRCLGAAVFSLATGCTSLACTSPRQPSVKTISAFARATSTCSSATSRVDARMRRLLSDVPDMKRFGETYGLTATSNYTKYVRVNGPAVVWVVSASGSASLPLEVLELPARREASPT